ncbi:hypothetical protein DCC35_11290 [Mangrovivirga cuniculi]|uniref:Tc toxin complex TcA C-terminal TcB-binding domain-containing protein n=1 Tax=Mangrovivirga cuniculi TaxID=2715131 RepID=A0A4D7JGN6_9BACT|nr:hypothetical protein [Mangrovivirga cuniculi]QCK15289.1 hypothetical protein DCC35_11290 [Mangrovivirga cuniculi]
MEFYVIDKQELNGKLGVKFTYPEIEGQSWTKTYDTFELFGCEGLPVKSDPRLNGTSEQATWPFPKILSDLNYIEKEPGNVTNPESDFQLEENSLFSLVQYLFLLLKTPTFHKSYFAWQTSYFDRLMLDMEVIMGNFLDIPSYSRSGSWLPFFFADRKKTFMAFPLIDFGINRGDEREESEDNSTTNPYYYPEIKAVFKDYLRNLEENIRTAIDNLDFTGLSDSERVTLANFFADLLDEEPYTSITIDELKDLIVRFYMAIFKFYFGAISGALHNLRKYHFKNFYHPFICDFIKLVYNPTQGIPALMNRNTQLKDSGFSFEKMYDPTNRVFDFNIGEKYPKEIVDFSPDGSYSPYNWELFYHTPLMIANSLSKNQRFEEAMDWYHYIFNPIGVEGAFADGSTAESPQKYWITKPFFLTTNEDYNKQRIDTILRMIAGDTTTENFSSNLKEDLEAQVLDWQYNPFEPHRIAQYRNVAYQKTVFMKYLDNLIAWGDHLFRQDSMESINEATQLYILAAELLGPKPQNIPPQVIPPIETFNELEDDFDDFSNALIQIENYIPPMPGDSTTGGTVAPIPTLYFCIPQNEILLSYWDTVADRLYKIRHCMNIEGVVRQLSLFEPEIDPGALVKAVAGGMGISSALADLNAPLPYYRFDSVLLKANEVCNDVKSLGNSLLSALEKKDAEEMALLRQSHEIKLMEAIKSVRELQIEETIKNLDGLKESLELTKIKIDYYDSREFMNAGEIVASVLNATSIALHTTGTISDILAGVMFLIPDFKMGASGFGGSPHFAAEPPTGNKMGESISRGANGLYNVANILDKTAAMSNTIASYQRRSEEWEFQKELAEQELVQIEEQIRAAEIRIDIAKKELANQELQIENSKEVDDFMKSKYTNKELYQWMTGQISQVYFKSYQLAYDLAKKPKGVTGLNLVFRNLIS